MSEFASIGVRVGADIAPLQQGLSRGSKSIDKFATDTKSSLDSASKSILAVGAAAAAAGAAIIAGLYKSGSEAIDAQAKLAIQLRTTSESMATLTRAGDLAGIPIEKISASAKKLDIELGKAAGGSAKQVDLFNRLGLSAQNLSAVPLDQRITAINNAINANIPITERAAVAAELFGSKNAAAMQMLDPATIDTARKQAQLFGLAISDIDAAKVEQANDAFSIFGVAAEGLTQQLTVQLAPIVQALGDQFLGAAEEAGGFGNVAKTAVDKVINVVGFLIDAVDAIKRVFSLVADAGIIAFGEIQRSISKVAYDILQTLSYLPGVDYSETMASLAKFNAEATAVVAEAKKNIDDTLMAPMPSEAFKDIVDKARVASEEAAKATIAARDAAGIRPTESSVTTSDPIADSTANDAKLEALRSSLKSELELLGEKHISEQQLLIDSLEAKRITQEEYDQLAIAAQQNYQVALNDIEQRASDDRLRIVQMEQQARKQILGNALSDLTTLMNSKSRKMFEIGKAAAISQTVLGTIESAQKSYSALAGIPVVGPALGIAAAGAATLAGMARVQAIRSQSFGGSGGAGAASNTQNVNAASTPVTQGGGANAGQTLTIAPIDPNAIFSGSAVGGLLGQINSFVKDGGKLVMAQ
jgi:hypothetical protein